MRDGQDPEQAIMADGNTTYASDSVEVDALVWRNLPTLTGML